MRSPELAISSTVACARVPVLEAKGAIWRRRMGLKTSPEAILFFPSWMIWRSRGLGSFQGYLCRFAVGL